MRSVFVNLIAGIGLLGLATSTSGQAETDALDLPLLSETGQLMAINDFMAPIRLVFFGFTYCPDICPLTLYKVGSAVHSLGLPDGSIDMLFVSVDPKRDTPEVLTRYTDVFHEDITGLSGDINQLQNLAQRFRTSFGYNLNTDAGEQPLSAEHYAALSPDDNYTPYHSSQIYLLNESGEIVDLIGHGSDAKLIAQTIQKVLNP